MYIGTLIKFFYVGKKKEKDFEMHTRVNSIVGSCATSLGMCLEREAQ